MEQEDRDRLTRVETKLDLFLPLVQKNNRDILGIKAVVGFLGFIFTALSVYFSGGKH